jgi:hypothetical protein
MTTTSTTVPVEALRAPAPTGTPARRTIADMLRAFVLRRACRAARAELRSIGDSRLGAVGASRVELLAVIHAFEAQLLHPADPPDWQ